ncbi:MAG: hypothetical protein ACREJ4_12810 [Candidatus Methylomirabilaceae bacterium]
MVNRRHRRGAVKGASLLIGVVWAVAACTTWRVEPTVPGPGVPVISHLRVEPEKVKVEEEIALTFDFEDSDADLVEAYIFPSEVRDWVFTPARTPTVLNLKGTKHGRAIGSIETTFKYQTDGVRIFEVFVVDEKGNTSNKLRTRVTIIPQ